MVQRPRQPATGEAFTQPLDVEAFRQRQAADLARYTDVDGETVVRRKPFYQRLQDGSEQRARKRGDDKGAVCDSDEDDEGSEVDSDGESAGRDGKVDADAGEESWRNNEGERLSDFGVDEVADFYDEDHVPLAEMRRRKAGQ